MSHPSATGKPLRAGRALLWALMLAVAGAMRVPGQEPAPSFQPWWNAAWRYRTQISMPASGPAVCRLWLPTGDRARPDGSDIRLVDGAGAAMNFAVVHSTPDGRHLIVFERPQPPAAGAPPASGPPAAYYGNPSAPAVTAGRPRAGLLLETWAMPEKADVSSWNAAQRSLAGLKTLYGRDFYGQIFDAYNPFGPSADYVSIYDGYVQCPQDGTYQFAVISDDASFLFIDDRLIAEWPGRGHNVGEGLYGQHSGAAGLSAGPHRIRFVAFAFGGPRRAAAAWLPPGAPAGRFQIIPPGAFGELTEATPGEVHQFRAPACAAFSHRPLNYLEAGDSSLVAVQFRSHSSAPGGTIRSLSWDFGDGQTDATAKPVHVFLTLGVHTVKLTVTTDRGATDAFSIPLDVQPIWNDLDFERWKKDKFLAWVKDYSVANLPTGHLLGYRDLMKDLEERKAAFEASVELDKRRTQLTKAQVYSVAMDLAAYYLDPLAQWEPAEQYYQLALRQIDEGDMDRLFDLRFRMAELYFYYMQDMALAEASYDSLRRDFPYGDPIRRRIALIRIGDIKRNQGRLKEAEAFYEEAQTDARYVPPQNRAIIEGSYRQNVESFLNQGEGRRALETLEYWLWTYPTARLSGETFLLNLRANMLLRNYTEVRKQAGTYLFFADEANYLPAIRVLAGEACMELGDLKAAREQWQSVLDKWPESPAVTSARNWLVHLDRQAGSR